MFFGPGGRFPNLVEELEAIPQTDKAVYAAEAAKVRPLPVVIAMKGS